MSFSDNKEVRIGAGDDLKLYHNGTHSFITNATGNLNITPASGSPIVLDGTINVDAGVVTGATSITSTAFVGTLSTAAQTNITSLGTLSALTISGDLTVDTSTLKVDSSNNRVGIGVATPAAPLDVMVAGANQVYIRNSDNSAQNNAIVSLRSGGYSNIALDGATVDLKIGGSSKVHVDANGKVGIGTSSPGKSLVIDSSNADPGLLIIKKNSGNNVAYIGTGSSGATEYGIMQLMHAGSTDVQLYAEGTSWINGGNLGIGTTAPSALAHVYNGTLQVGSKTGDTSIQQNTNAIRIAAVPNSSTEWGGLQWYREFSDVIGAEIIAARATSTETDTDLIFKTSTNSSNAVEAMRIEHSGGLKIGTGSYTNSQYYASDVVINAANEGGLTIANSANSHASYIMFADGVSSGSEQYAGYIEYNHSADRMRVKSNGTFQIYAVGLGADAFLVRTNGNISLHGPSNDDVGGTGAGIVFTANNQIRVGGNDGSNMYTGYQLMLDRMNTPGDGPNLVLSRNGYFKAAIGGLQGASGNATSAEGNLAFYTATTSAFYKRMQISSGGHAEFYHDFKHNPNSANGHRYMLLNRTSGMDGHIVFRQSGTNQWQQTTDSSHNLNFYSYQNSSRTQVQFLSGGDVEINDGNLIVQNGHGIDFSDTGGPTHTGTDSSELLDDYEEGTFTPYPEAYYGNSVTFSGSFSGWYVKIGAKVTVAFKGDNFSFTSGNGGDLVGFRLPFNPTSGQSEGMGNITTHGWSAGGRHLGTLLLSTTNAQVGAIGSNNNNGSWAWMDYNSVGSGNTSFRAIFTYFVTN